MRLHGKRLRGILNKASMLLAVLIVLSLTGILTGIFTSSNVLAMTGNSGNITMNGGISRISYAGSKGTIATFGQDGALSGMFENSEMFEDGDINGFFGPDMNSSSNVLSAVQLVSPQNDSVIVNTSMDFSYMPASVFNMNNCSLYIDGKVRAAEYSVDTNSLNTITVDDVAAGKHQWNMTCDDYHNTLVYSQTQPFTVIRSSIFDENSTDFTQVNISSIQNLTLSKSGEAKVVFHGTTDLSGGADLDGNIVISPLSVVINSAALPALNKSATLVMYNVPFKNIIIWHNGQICTDCNILSASGGQLTFNVTGFSNYTITSTSKLSVSDTTDKFLRYVKQSILFTANYSNISSGAPLAANCTISFNNGTWTAPLQMPYDSSSGLYTFTQSFNNTGTQLFSVSCNTTTSGFDDLAASNNFLISAMMPGALAKDVDAKVISSSSANLSLAASNVSSMAGNITELLVNSTIVSRAWQGYYGDVSGNVVLKDANNKIFYDWNLSSVHGEIFASRSNSIEWSDVKCANTTELYSEDSYLSMNSATDGESVFKTFFNTTSFRDFYAGNSLIVSSQECYATNLYSDAGPQNDAFAEIILSDSHAIIYTGLIENHVTGFDSQAHDFEMIVGENGRADNSPTPYYFYIEIV